MSFFKFIPGVGHAIGAIEMIVDPKEGLKTMKKANEGVQHIPVVGHVAGGIAYAVGDTEYGDAAMKQASRATATVGGALVGGPAGAVAAGLAADQLIGGIDAAIKGEEWRGSGAVKDLVNGDILGAGLTLAGDAAGGKGGMLKSGVKGGLKKHVQKGMKNHIKHEVRDNVVSNIEKEGARLLARALIDDIRNHPDRWVKMVLFLVRRGHDLYRVSRMKCP